MAHQSPSEMPDLAGYFNRITGIFLLGSGKLNSGDTKFLVMETPVPDDSRVTNHSPSDTSDLAGDFIRTTTTPLLGSGK